MARVTSLFILFWARKCSEKREVRTFSALIPCVMLAEKTPVALYARAWIETPLTLFITFLIRVALYARAWIETCYLLLPALQYRSLSTRERGLKPFIQYGFVAHLYVALYARARIETYQVMQDSVSE